jgi:hypothetical protein
MGISSAGKGWLFHGKTGGGGGAGSLCFGSAYVRTGRNALMFQSKRVEDRWRNVSRRQQTGQPHREHHPHSITSGAIFDVVDEHNLPPGGGKGAGGHSCRSYRTHRGGGISPPCPEERGRRLEVWKGRGWFRPWIAPSGWSAGSYVDWPGSPRRRTVLIVQALAG